MSDAMRSHSEPAREGHDRTPHIISPADLVLKEDKAGLRLCMPLICRFSEQPHCLFVVLFDAVAIAVHDTMASLTGLLQVCKR